MVKTFTSPVPFTTNSPRIKETHGQQILPLIIKLNNHRSRSLRGLYGANPPPDSCISRNQYSRMRKWLLIQVYTLRMLMPCITERQDVKALREFVAAALERYYNGDSATRSLKLSEKRKGRLKKSITHQMPEISPKMIHHLKKTFVGSPMNKSRLLFLRLEPQSEHGCIPLVFSFKPTRSCKNILMQCIL